MSENYIVINGNKAELTDEQLKQLGIEIEKNNNPMLSKWFPQRWRAKKNEGYFFVNYGNKTQHLIDVGDEADNMLYRTHNYFKTKVEAEKYARVLETELELKEFAEAHNTTPIDWENANKAKWFMAYNYFADRIVIDWDWSCCSKRNVYFDTEGITKQAITEIGEDKIKEYLTYEW